jgi:hypothetical protein
MADKGIYNTKLIQDYLIIVDHVEQETKTEDHVLEDYEPSSQESDDAKKIQGRSESAVCAFDAGGELNSFRILI